MVYASYVINDEGINGMAKKKWRSERKEAAKHMALANKGMKRKYAGKSGEHQTREGKAWRRRKKWHSALNDMGNRRAMAAYPHAASLRKIIMAWP